MTLNGTAGATTVYEVDLPTTFDNSGLPSALAAPANPGGLEPAMTLDTDALYFTNGEGIYKVGL